MTIVGWNDDGGLVPHGFLLISLQRYFVSHRHLACVGKPANLKNSVVVLGCSPVAAKDTKIITEHDSGAIKNIYV